MFRPTTRIERWIKGKNNNRQQLQQQRRFIRLLGTYHTINRQQPKIEGPSTIERRCTENLLSRGCVSTSSLEWKNQTTNQHNRSSFAGWSLEAINQLDFRAGRTVSVTWVSWWWSTAISHLHRSSPFRCMVVVDGWCWRWWWLIAKERLMVWKSISVAT